jgi:hypothetical protein
MNTADVVITAVAMLINLHQDGSVCTQPDKYELT